MEHFLSLLFIVATVSSKPIHQLYGRGGTGGKAHLTEVIAADAKEVTGGRREYEDYDRDRFTNEGRSTEDEDYNAPRFRAPNSFIGNFEDMGKFSGPFGRDENGFAQFLNSVNLKAFGSEGSFPGRSEYEYEREENDKREDFPSGDDSFHRPQPVYTPEERIPDDAEFEGFDDFLDPHESFETPNDFKFAREPLEYEEFQDEQLQHGPTSYENEEAIFDPSGIKHKSIIRPIQKQPAHFSQGDYYDIQDFRKPVNPLTSLSSRDHEIIHVPLDGGKFRPITKDYSAEKDLTIYDNDQEIITASPLPKRRYVSPKRAQTFDVKLGAGFNTREGKPLDERILRPVRPQ